MILTTENIKAILKDNPNKELVARGRRYNKTMRLHLYGDGLDKHLTQIEGFETPAIKELRTKYAQSNKPLFARLLRPIDKVFSARGGSTYYNLSEEANKSANQLTNNLKGGLSVKKWVENYWKPHFLDDPFGIVFMEIDQEGNVYPTYKSIESIYDYEPNGVNLEYIVFHVSDKEKKSYGLKPEATIYRVVDDAGDYLVQVEGERVSILENLSYENFFGVVPGMINSDIIDSEKQGFLSLFDDIIVLADDYLLTGSIRTTHKFLHGYPKYWEYADDCGKCENGLFEGKKCNECYGTGKRIMTKVSDAKLLSLPQSKEDPIITPNVAGYVEPSEIYHNISTQELVILEDAMNFTIWGKSIAREKPNVNVEGKTATQVLDEVKPEESRLLPISESAEKRHKFIVDLIIEVELRQGYAESVGSSINYGRRYMLEGADALWERYSDARTKGAAVSVLDDLLMEFIETKYSGDPVGMAIQLKLMRVEPFVHMTVEKVDSMQSISPEDKAMKIYFGEWLSSVNDAMVLSMSYELLREQLRGFAGDKIVVPEPVKIPV